MPRTGRRIRGPSGSSDIQRVRKPTETSPPPSWWTSTAPESGSASSPSRCPRPGEAVVFAPEETAQQGEIPTTYPELAGDIRRGSLILLDDGLLAVEVTGVRGDRVDGKVRYGGLLKANKGMNLPGVDVSAPAVTDTRSGGGRPGHRAGGRVHRRLLRPARRGHPAAAARSSRRGSRLIAKIEKDTAARQSRQHPRRLRRRDGGPRRPRRGDAVRAGAIGAEADHPERQSSRQAGDHGDPDARVDGRATPARPGPRPPTSPTRSSMAPMP